MRYSDICKFTSTSLLETLTVDCFVMETNPTVMRKTFVLEKKRMILILKGEGKIYFDDSEISFVAGNLIFGFEGEKFKVSDEKDVAYAYISFGGNRADDLFRRFNVKPINRSFGGFDGLIPLWTESLCRASEQTIDLAAESIVLYTFSRLYDSASQLSGLVSDIVDIVEKKFDDPDLSMNVIAEKLSYNPKYVSHLFKQKIGVSFSEYLRSVRIKFAVSLFDHGIDSVKNVALLSGFYDPLYFSTVFKKVVGVSPKEYAKKVLEQKDMPI